MTRKSQPQRPPPAPGLPIFGRGHNPINEFKRLARDDGKPYKAPEPKAELQLLALLGSKAAAKVMSCVLVVVVATLLVILLAKL